MKCYDGARGPSFLNSQLVAIRRLMDSGRLPHLNRALCRIREVVTASFSLSSDRENSIDCELIDRSLGLDQACFSEDGTFWSAFSVAVL